ncbi:MAG: MFS transporter [Actinomycetota bacterium]
MTQPGPPSGGHRPHGPGREAFVVTPFTRVARTHAVLVAGDALIALALAGSLFFSIEPDAARTRIALYLAFTIAPFALVSPLIGPAIDRARGGRRLMIVLTALVRSLACFLMVGHLDSLLLFPEAFAALVAGKGYHVAKSALVPTVVRTEADLVQANSRLALLAGISGAVAFIPGGILLRFGGSEWVMGFAAIVFSFGAILALRIPATSVATEPVGEAERAELRGAGIIAAASSMAVLRGIVGFVAFLLAFHLRSIEASTVWFGVLLAASTVGNMVGAVTAPVLRRTQREELILAGVLVITTITAGFVALSGGLGGATALVLVVGFAAGAGKMSFDSIVQRDAPDANQGRSFARFETRFQLVWVAGALIPTVLPFDVLSVRLGYVVISVLAGFAAFTYVAALRAIARGERPQPIRIPAKVRDPVVARARDTATHLRGRVVARREARRPGPQEPPRGGDPGPISGDTPESA